MSALGNIPVEIAARRIFAAAREKLADAPDVEPGAPFYYTGDYEGITVTVIITKSEG